MLVISNERSDISFLHQLNGKSINWTPWVPTGDKKSRACCNFENFVHEPEFDIKFWKLTSNFEIHTNISENFDYIYKKMYRWSINPNVIEGHFWYQNRTFRPKKRKVTYLQLFWNFWPQTPTWHEFLKPIRILVTIFISYISRYIHNLYTHKVWIKLKDTFDDRPIRPIKLALRARLKACGAGPRRDIVGATYIGYFWKKKNPTPQLDIKFWNP